ncbi:MAG: 3-dehydroquinate synthase [Desulfobacterales bacterium]|nr:3-dehydroquinate synthase [Desulfobacterales bacterium]
MKTIAINIDSSPSRILIAERLENLQRYIPVAKPIIVTDVNVGKLYPLDAIAGGVITIGTGETIKTLDTVEDIYAQLLSLQADRSAFIVGVGGGIVCDITGFAASTFMRGVRFGFVATSLLAQVDASVGGKNGVNFQGYKNMVGLFHQPEFVICDLEVLKTLPPREISCGLAEIVKHAAIADADLFAFLEEQAESVLALDPEAIEKLVLRSVEIKSAIVSRDETEKGERRLLNFGHTFGHAIEKVSGISHGEAVSIGMVMAAALSVKRGLLSAQEDRRLRDLLAKLQLPNGFASDPQKILDAVTKDKKKAGDRIHFILLAGIGNAVVEPIAIEELEEALYA